jgi:predicted amidohydrolase
MHLRIAMAQMLVTGGALKENLARAVSMIERAKKESAAIVVLPECLDLGWGDEQSAKQAAPIPGHASRILSDAARAFGIDVVAGLTERAKDGLYNASVYIDNEGRIIGQHRKIHELAIVHHIYKRGTSLSAIDTSIGRVGISICADNSPETVFLGHSLGRMGVKLILSPCAWAVPTDHDNGKEPYGAMWESSYGELAKKHGLTIVGVSNVGVVSGGPWKGWRCIGCSLAVGPKGVIAKLPYGVDAEELRVIEAETD